MRHLQQNNVFCGDSPMGALTLHVVARKPIHEFTAVELCVMLPELTSVNVVQVRVSAFDLRVARTQTHTHTLTHSLTHSLSLSLSLTPSLTHSHTHLHTFAHSHSLAHTHAQHSRCQIIPSDRLHGELKCDDVLPGDDALPAQRLRVSTITGNYSELLEHDCKDVPTPGQGQTLLLLLLMMCISGPVVLGMAHTPSLFHLLLHSLTLPLLMYAADLVLFMDSGRQADPQIQADFEDAVDHLSKRRVPIIFTQRFRERHAEIKQWLRDMQVAVAQGTCSSSSSSSKGQLAARQRKQDGVEC